jgi:hypothetical protein
MTRDLMINDIHSYIHEYLKAAYTCSLRPHTPVSGRPHSLIFKCMQAHCVALSRKSIK